MAASTDVVVDHDIEEMLGDITKQLHKKRLMVFNDDHHSQFEVVVAIMRARETAGDPCTPEQATRIMMEAHKSGQGQVMSDGVAKLKKAQEVRDAFGLATDIID